MSVDPVDLKERTDDELVAQLRIDWEAALRAAGREGQTDLSTIQVHKFDPATGKPEPFKAFETARSPYDRPCRFEDDAVPADYPDRATNCASEHSSGKGPITIRNRGGRLFNRLMKNDHGKLTWVHTQRGSAASHYAIYWDIKSLGQPTGPSPAPWIGDVDVLRQKEGGLLSGLSHFTVCAGDLNGDGLFDLAASAEKGDFMWFPNLGRPGKPRFDGCVMLGDEDGPIDAGWYGAPFMYDWDNDGLLDVLIGTSHNVILWWKNTGTRTTPMLSYRGFVQADGGRLEVPEAPVPEDTAAIFARDYYNQPWVGDWDGDSLPDILTGGYTTGLVFFYRATGRDAKGVPELKYMGPLQADDKTIDTIWAAAPFAADVDNDNRLDLLTGGWFWTGMSRAPQPGETDYLIYYHNDGGHGHPACRRAAFPRKGEFPRGSIARPTLVDWDEDGLLDLISSDSSGSCYWFRNVGSRTAPMWEMNSQPLTAPWAFVRSSGFTSAVDMDGDGRLELLMGDSFNGFEGSPYTPRSVHRGSIRVDGRALSYPGPGYGDGYYYTALCDWNRDGVVDLLWGTQQGNLYLHFGLSRSDPFSFDRGVKLKLTDGQDLRVGPPVVDSPKKATDFTILQGSRIVVVVSDFDKDGIDDLGITETYGQLWVFRNTRSGGLDTLEPGVLVGKVLGARRSDEMTTVDWNEDGKTDLMVGQTAAKPGTIYLNQSVPGKPRFAAPVQPLDLPYVFFGASFKPMDWNGDGDEDFLISSEFYMFFAEKSFLQHGYVKAVRTAAPEVKEAAGL